MRLHLTVDVPTSADKDAVLKALTKGAHKQQGVTITLPNGQQVDVDLALVECMSAVSEVV